MKVNFKKLKELLSKAKKDFSWKKVAGKRELKINELEWVGENGVLKTKERFGKLYEIKKEDRFYLSYSGNTYSYATLEDAKEAANKDFNKVMKEMFD